MHWNDLKEGEQERILHELRQSGYPLEHRVAITCRAAQRGPVLGSGRFTWRDEGVYRIDDDGTETHIPLPFARYPSWEGESSMWSSHRLVYRDDRATPAGPSGVWREIDRLFEFQTYVNSWSGPEDATISLHAQALIECKHRNDLVLVGFPDPDQRPTAFPMVGTMAPTRMISAVGRSIPQPCAGFQRVMLGGMEKKEKGGWHAAKEELSYKATGSLYDYLVVEWTPWATGEVHPFLRESGIWQELEPQLSSPYFHPSSWIHHHLKPEWCEQFNAQHVDWHLIPSFKLVLPIVCVDMPLMLATLDDQGTMTNLTPTAGVVVEERIHSWPGRVDHVRYTPILAGVRFPVRPSSLSMLII